ncbi:MAG: fimbria/pilus periplasmic chaperone [Hyphomicrobium sp.]|nr:fimbria/pilus periplasmic chaperone [Hyphomicrobium sp.]
MSARKMLTFCAGITFALMSSFAAKAMTVSPMQVEMMAAGSKATARVTVTNNSTEPLPVEAVIARLKLDENGRQSTSKAGEEFLIMPPQAMIPPGGTQNFRVQWLGEPLMDTSESFLLFINQLPVKLARQSVGVQVVMSLGVMINVAPAQGQPALKIVGTGASTAKNGKKYPVVTVENVSKVHALLPQATMHLNGDGWEHTLSPAMLGDRIGIGLVQPGRRRKFTLPVELPPGAQGFEAAIEMKPKR